MTDSDALRSRRKRLHAAGDHSLCRRCGAVRAVVPVTAAPKLSQAAPVQLLETPEGRVDAQASLEALARRLEAAHEASPGDAQVARVLKDVLLALRGPGEGADDELAKFDAEFSRA